MSYQDPLTQQSETMQRIVQYGVRFPDGEEVWAAPEEQSIPRERVRGHSKLIVGTPGNDPLDLVDRSGAPTIGTQYGRYFGSFVYHYVAAAVRAGLFTREEDVPRPVLVKRELFVVASPSTVIWEKEQES
jgi:hypothetical protein